MPRNLKAMSKGNYIATVLILICPIILYGSCGGPFFSITELLNHDPKNHHIFTCKILKTYIRGHSFESIAVVQNRFNGSPEDTVFINSGGGTSAGGKKLYPNSEWLIFSTTNDSTHYWATVCDPLSTQILKGTNEECRQMISSLGEVYLDVLDQYEMIRKGKFSGYKEIYGGGKLIAKGSFLNGIPHGDWTHYSRYDEFKRGIKKSDISYQNGQLQGKYHIYHVDEDQNNIIEKREFESGLPVLMQAFGKHTRKYEYKYISDKERKIIYIKKDYSGIELKRITSVEFDYNNKKYKPIEIRSGYYFNKLGRDSSNFFPLAEGYYLNGAKIGEWKFYNKKGALIETKNYPDSLDNLPHFQIYDDDGNVRLTGWYDADENRVGLWKYFYNGRLAYEEVYNSSGELLSRIHHYTNGGFELTPYLNNVKHGQQIIFNADKTIRSIENYSNGRLHGLSIFFNENGAIEKELNFINSRAFSINKLENGTYYSNGFLNGYFVQHNYDTGKITYEGTLWNGYRTGLWIEYNENGSFTKKYYPTDREELMNQCSFTTPLQTEQYDKEGNLRD